MLYIGIDLGTSAVKLLLLDGGGAVLNTVSREYPLCFPRPGWSEQNPEDWRRAVLEGIPQLLAGFDAGEVAGIGASGQMHGLVALDAGGEVIRPAILWNDGRTGAEVDYLNGEVGRDKLSGWTANIAFAGFTAPKLLWMRRNEPENFARIAKIMLPKDYINYVLTGAHCAPVAIASPFTSAMPMRRPVKLPGPAQTASSSASPTATPAALQAASNSGRRLSLWVSPALRVDSYSRVSSRKMATPAVLPAASMPMQITALLLRW